MSIWKGSRLGSWKGSRLGSWLGGCLGWVRGWVREVGVDLSELDGHVNEEVGGSW